MRRRYRETLNEARFESGKGEGVGIQLQILNSRVPELDPALYGLSLEDNVKSGYSLNDLAEQLRLIYCGPTAIEFMHINVKSKISLFIIF